MKPKKSAEEQRQQGMACIVIGFVFLAVGIFVNRTFLMLGIVFFFLAISLLAPSRPKP